MKRLLLLFTAIAAFVFISGCNREPADSALRAEYITATFDISVPGEIGTKAISDGAGATELLFKVYDANGNHLDLDQKVTVSAKKATVTAKLVRGVAYKFVFWAQFPSRYTIQDNADGHPSISLSADDLADMMNNDSYDAFYAVKETEPKDADFTENVTLTRPFAQINVGASSDDVAVAVANAIDLNSNLSTSFTIKGVKTDLDLLTGEASGSADATYASAAAPADNILTTEGVRYRRIAMVYLIAPATQSATVQTALDVTAKQSGDIDVAFTREVPNVPISRNKRTNIVGEVFSLDGTFNVVVDANFNETDRVIEMDVPAPVPTVFTVSIDPTIANGTVALAGQQTEFEEEETVTLTVTPAESYELSSLVYVPEEGGDATEIDKETCSFAMPPCNVVVVATFSEVVVPPTPSGEGSGTADDPYTVAGARSYIDGLTAFPSEAEVYVKGVVSQIVSSPSSTYSNATFWITDPNGTDKFEVFRINYFNNDPWTTSLPMVAVNDEVVVFGKVTLYQPTNGDPVYETYQKANTYNGYLVSVNGKSSTQAAPVISVTDATGAPATQIPAEDGASLTVSITGSNVHFSIDGSEPTANSPAYSTPFNVTAACTVKAIALGDDTTLDSPVVSQAITKASATPSGDHYYVKVTSTAGITDGNYLIVYEAENVAFDGGRETLDAASNTISVEISDGKIASNETTDAAAFTISVSNGTILSKSGFYIGVTTYSNGLKQNADASTYGAHSFSIAEAGNAIVKLSNDSWAGDMILNYNANANDKRFRYYKNGSQKVIHLYKYE